MSFRFNQDAITRGLDRLSERADEAVRIYAETSALKLQGSAQENAPWTDRTGHARQRLKGDVLTVNEGYKLRLAHGVDYGAFLELANERRYAIIEQTIQKVGEEEIMPGFEHLMERLKE